MKLLAMLGGAALVGVVVWLSAGAEAAALIRGAGWWSVVVLAFPAFIAFGVWRGWGDDEIMFRDH